MTITQPADADQLARELDRAGALAHEDPAAAEAVVRSCSATASALGLPGIDAQASYLLARLHAERGRLGEALELIDRARQLWFRAGRPVWALRTDLGRMQILDDQGHHAEAVAVGEALITALDGVAVPEADDAELRDNVRADALGNIGVACSFLGAHERSLDAYARCEQLYLALGRSADTARPRANRGIELLALGRPREALAALQSAESTFAAGGDRIWAAKCAGHVGQAHLRMGELVQALAVLEPAALTLRELAVAAEAVRIELTIASVHLASGLYAEAAAGAAAAIDRTRDAGMTHDQAFATLTLALAELGAGQLSRAAQTLVTAGALFGEVADRQYAAQVLLASAEVAVRSGDADAYSRARKAVTALRAGGWLIPLARAHLVAADAAPDDRTRAASLDAAAPLIAELGLPSLRYAATLRRGRLRRRSEAIDEAAELLTRAVDIAEEMGVALPDPILQTAFRTDKAPAYDELIDLLVTRNRRGDIARALTISDLAKARTLTDLVGRTAHARHTAARDSPELDQCQVDLSAVYAALTDEPAASRRDLLWQRAASLEQRIVALRTRIAAMAPAPDRSRHVDDAKTSRGHAGQPVLRYHVAGEDILTFVSVDGRDHVARQPGAARQVDRALDELSGQWRRFRLGPAFVERNAAQLEQTAGEVLRQLYNLLVAPVRPWLDDTNSIDLTVIPHRRLGEVPFHALDDGEHPLVESWAVTIAPTASPAAMLGDSISLRPPLVIAVPDPAAPAIEAEAQALSSALPNTELIVGPAATTDRLHELLRGRRVVHLACHGLYRASNPLLSALRFADRWLTSAEVLELDIDGSLIVLSACESGRPGRASAEPVGLTWAFLAAGASGAIASQWLVDDVAAAEFAPLVHRHLATGLSPAHAVRLAHLAVRERHPHPYHWAPFGYVASPALVGVHP